MELYNHEQKDIKDTSLVAWPNGELSQLLLWKNWRQTGLIFCIILTLLLDMAANSVISVISVAGVLVLLISICYYCCVWGMRKLRKSNIVDHPYQHYLNMDINISEETVEQLSRLIAQKLNPILSGLRSLYLVEDPLDSIKLLLFLCGLNVLGDYINGITLVIVGFVLLFTLPKLYEWKKPFIDTQFQKLQLLKAQLLGTKEKVLIATPTVTVDPQFLSPDQMQKTEDNNSDLEYDTDQFVSFEQESGHIYTNEYLWQQQDTPSESYQHLKEQ